MVMALEKFLGRTGQRELSGSEIFEVGEFSISQYTDDSLLITKEGEAMELNLDTLRRFWREFF